MAPILRVSVVESRDAHLWWQALIDDSRPPPAPSTGEGGVPDDSTHANSSSLLSPRAVNNRYRYMIQQTIFTWKLEVVEAAGANGDGDRGGRRQKKCEK